MNQTIHSIKTRWDNIQKIMGLYQSQIDDMDKELFNSTGRYFNEIDGMMKVGSSAEDIIDTLTSHFCYITDDDAKKSYKDYVVSNMGENILSYEDYTEKGLTRIVRSSLGWMGWIN